MPLESILQDIGLTKKEAAVYIAALELGHASVLRIAQKADIKRPTVYVALSSLQEKGLVVIVPKGTTTLYQATDPEQLLEKFNEKLQKFKFAIPELKAISNASPNKPRVRFYEGKNAIFSLYENEIFARKKEIIGVVSMRDVRKILTKDEALGMLHLMKADGIFIRDILEKSQESEEYLKEKNRLALGETKFLPPELHFDIDILVYENTVAMISPKTEIAVLIEDIAIASSQRQFLEFLWKSL